MTGRGRGGSRVGVTLRDKTTTQKTLEDMPKKFSFKDDGEWVKKLEALEKKVGRLAEKMKKETEEGPKERQSLNEGVSRVSRDVLKVEKDVIESRQKNLEMGIRLENLEKRFEKLEELFNQRFAGWERDGGSMSGAASLRSGQGSSWSVNSGVSCLSERDMVKVKRMLTEQDRKERENNIAIKGLGTAVREGMGLKERVEGFIREKLELAVVILEARVSGGAVIAKLGSRQEKIEVMKSKSKLKGSDIYIENDLNYEDRKTQEEMARWVRVQRQKGTDVKLGQGAVKINNAWVKWRDVNKNKEMGGGNSTEEGHGRNFP